MTGELDKSKILNFNVLKKKKKTTVWAESEK